VLCFRDDVSDAAANDRCGDTPVIHVVRAVVDALAQVLEAFLAEVLDESAVTVCLVLRAGHLRSM
jgi:hypothetical protein